MYSRAAVHERSGQITHGAWRSGVFVTFSCKNVGDPISFASEPRNPSMLDRDPPNANVRHFETRELILSKPSSHSWLEQV